MDAKLQLKLYKKYPSIFKDKNKSIKESCMPWGIATGNGWYNIIDGLCAYLKNVERNNKGIKIVASQVKEKFGTLRFYYHLEGNLESLTNQETKARFYGYVDGAIDYAFFLSARTCEDCGGIATVQTKGYISNVCIVCKRKRELEFRNNLNKIKSEAKIKRNK